MRQLIYTHRIAFKSSKFITNEPWNDKTNQMSVHPAKVLISLGIPQSDQSLLYDQWASKDPSFLHMNSEDSNQTELVSRLTWP